MAGKYFLPFFILVLTVNSYSESLFEKGELLFRENRTAEAVSILQGALEKEPENEKIYLYLGFSYAGLGDYDKSVKFFREGAQKSLAEKDVYYYNAGNIYYLKGDFTLAEGMFTQAVKANGGNTAGYLNRANSRLKLDMKKEALSDYRIYLNLEPATYQRESIEKLIALLESDIEDEKIREEEKQVRKQAEEERRKALLEDVLNSLENVGKETRNISAESEKIDDYKEELELEE